MSRRGIYIDIPVTDGTVKSDVADMYSFVNNGVANSSVVDTFVRLSIVESLKVALSPDVLLLPVLESLNVAILRPIRLAIFVQSKFIVLDTCVGTITNVLKVCYEQT